MSGTALREVENDTRNMYGELKIKTAYMNLVSRGIPDISMSGTALREMIPEKCMRNLNKERK